MSEQGSLERQLKRARLLSAYESHQVSATRVASHAIGRSVRMPWKIAENFLGMPSLPSPFEKGGCLIAASSKVPASVDPAKPAPARLESLRLAGVKIPKTMGPSWDQKLSEAREAALAKWLGLLERYPDDFGNCRRT